MSGYVLLFPLALQNSIAAHMVSGDAYADASIDTLRARTVQRSGLIQQEYSHGATSQIEASVGIPRPNVVHIPEA